MGLDLDGLDLEENDEEDEEEEEEEEEDVLGFWYSIVWLTIITVFISFLRYANSDEYMLSHLCTLINPHMNDAPSSILNHNRMEHMTYLSCKSTVVSLFPHHPLSPPLFQ